MKITLWIMVAIGLAFWLFGVVFLAAWMIVSAAVLVAYCAYQLLMERWTG